MGFEYVKRNLDTIEIQTPTSTQVWKVLIELPFDSIRKRMSVLVKEENQKNVENIYLFTKGADSSLMHLMSLTYDYKKSIKGIIYFIKRTFKGFCSRRIENSCICEKKI